MNDFYFLTNIFTIPYISKLAYKTMVLTGYSASKTPIYKTGLIML